MYKKSPEHVLEWLNVTSYTAAGPVPCFATEFWYQCSINGFMKSTPKTVASNFFPLYLFIYL